MGINQEIVPSMESVLTEFESMYREWSFYYEKTNEVSKYCAPYSYRPLNERTTTPRNTGLKNRLIRNPIGQTSKDIFASGFMSLATNPSEYWMRFRIPIEVNTEQLHYGQDEKTHGAQDYADKSTRALHSIWSRTNFYQFLKSSYEDISWSSNMAGVMEEDLNNVVRFRHLAPGSYMVQVDFKGRPVRMMIEHPMKNHEIVKEFGMVNASGRKDLSHLPSVVQEFNTFANQNRWSVLQMIQENPGFMPGEDGLRGKKYISIYYFIAGSSGGGFGGLGQNLLRPAGQMGKGSSGDRSSIGTVLRVSGTNENPMLFCPWKAAQDDVYGHESPGEMSLGWLKQIQYAELRMGQGIDYSIAPHFFGSSGLNINTLNAFGLVPGGMTLVDDLQALDRGLVPSHKTDFRVDWSVSNIERMESKVKENFFTNQIMKISDLGKSNVTATEINALNSEQLIIMVPTYGLMQDRYYGPAADFTISVATKQGKFPEAPESVISEIEEHQTGAISFGVEFVSALSNAQKLSKLTSTERLVNLIGQAKDVLPNISRKVKAEEVANIYAESLGAPASVMVGNKEYFRGLEAEANQVTTEEDLDNEKVAAETAKIQGDTVLPELSEAI